jgi:putative MATE family efflux protein
MGIERQRNHIGTDFTEGSIMPMLLRFMLPFLLASILNSLYNTVDTIIIGRFVGSVGIVSVNMGGRLLNLFTSISLTMAGGGQVLISQQFGAKRRDELNSTIGTLFTEMFVLSVVLAVVSSIVAPQVLGLLKTPEESFSGALSYLRITSLGLPLIFGYNAVSSVLRGMGDSRSPLIFIAIAAAFNLIGDIVFIVAFHMGAAGTAVATVLGQGISLIFSLTVLYRKRERFGFDFKLKSFAVDWKKLWIMVKIGFPLTLRSMFIHLTQMYILRFVNAYGLVESAAYAICDKVVHLTSIFTISTQQAASGMIGQNIGAKKPDRVVTIVRCTAIVTLACGAVLAASALLFPRAFFGLFTEDEAVLAYARTFMAVNALIYMLGASMAPFDAVVTGTGHSMLGFLGGILDGVVFRIGFSFLFAYGLHMGVTGFLLGDALARLGPILVSGIYYFSGAWRRRKRLVGDAD